jgi:hypothetical protein
MPLADFSTFWTHSAMGGVLTEDPFLDVPQVKRAGERTTDALTARLEARDSGSLFDLRKDTVKDIVDVIFAHVSEGRADNIANEIKGRLKKKKTPAG